MHISFLHCIYSHCQMAVLCAQCSSRRRSEIHRYIILTFGWGQVTTFSSLNLPWIVGETEVNIYSSLKKYWPLTKKKINLIFKNLKTRSYTIKSLNLKKLISSILCSYGFFAAEKVGDLHNGITTIFPTENEQKPVGEEQTTGIYFLTVLEATKSKIKVPVGFSFWFVDSCFVFPWSLIAKGGEKQL